RLGALAGRRGRSGVARHGEPAATLDRAGLSHKGAAPDGARSSAGARARRRFGASREHLDRARLPGRQGRARGNVRGNGAQRHERVGRMPQLAAALAALSLLQLLSVVGMALIASMVGGIAGYGTGVLMPLVLVPIVGAEPIVPIIAISALMTNASRAVAFRHLIDWRRTLIVLAAAVPTSALGAWAYTLLTSVGASIVIGGMLMLSVPLRRLLKRHEVHVSDGGLAVSSVGYGVVVGGTVGSGIILLSLLMAAGLEGGAVIATDATISIGVGLIKIAVFGVAGVMGAQGVAIALVVGGIAFPGAFLAKALVHRITIHLHPT